MITSSVTLPLVATKLPRAQMWRPQHCFWMCLNSIRVFREVLPLIYCIILLADKLGGQGSNVCTHFEVINYPYKVVFNVMTAMRTASIVFHSQHYAKKRRT